MHELTVEEIIAVHDRRLAGTPDDTRLISEPNLHQLAFRANREPEIFRRTALVIFSLVAYPAFRDGNKRTAIALAAEILEEVGYRFDGRDPALAKLLSGIAAFTTEQEDIEAWLRKNMSR